MDVAIDYLCIHAHAYHIIGEIARLRPILLMTKLPMRVVQQLVRKSFEGC